ncbi:MAG: DUF2971 domain-containing protein [Candidatus Omnitrophica bacterium]|nr:DUF2971 domain-containing protein [Candidatus Omnitrophota bacterium]
MGKIPEILYHYTNQKGLYEIINSKSLWMSNIAYLNDAEELNFGLKLIEAMAKKYAEETVIRKFVNELLKVLAKEVNICVFSFSAERDSLGQWRGYTKEGAGYNIGFDYNKLSDLQDKLKFKISQCVYDPQEQEAQIDKLFHNKFSEKKFEEVKEHIVDWAFDLVALATTLKNRHFENESEWRLITEPIHIKDKNYKTRADKKALIPYFKLDLQDLPVKEILVGPSCERPNLLKSSVEIFLEQQNILNCPVSISKIPYRPL